MKGIETIVKENKQADDQTNNKIELRDNITVEYSCSSAIKITYNGKIAKLTATVLRELVNRNHGNEFSTNDKILDMLLGETK